MKQMTQKSNELVARWNLHCENNNCHQDMVYYNDEEFFETHSITIRQTVMQIKSNYYNFDHDWVTLDGYANPISSDKAEDFIDIEEMEMEEWLDENAC